MDEIESTGDNSTPIETHWKQSDELLPTMADQLHIVGINDQYFLTFGQTRFLIDTKGTINAEIHPLVRFVLSKYNLEKVIRLLVEASKKGHP